MISAGSMIYRDRLGAEGLQSPEREGCTDSPQIDLFKASGWLATPVDRAITFGSFRLFPTRRLLLEGEKPVRVGSRAVEILVALVERAGELVSKDELMARVWPNTFVDESNLKVQVAGLRRVLGDRRGSNRYLVTISGRGYRFVALVTRAEVVSTPAEREHNLPAPIERMIDRTDAVAPFLPAGKSPRPDRDDCPRRSPKLRKKSRSHRDQILKRLEQAHQETPQAIGLAGDGGVVEVLVSPDGGWTMLLTYPKRPTCVVAAGAAWEMLQVAGEPA